MPTGLYLYGFVPHPPPAVPSRPGLDGAEILYLSHGRCAAVLSPIDPAPFLDELNTRDPDWVVPRAVAHQEAVAAVMALAPILPVRFGAVFSTPEAVRDFIGPRESRIAAFLGEVGDRQEWSVKASLVREQALEWLLAHDAELAARRAKLPAAPGTRYFLEKRLRADAEAKLDAASRTLAASFKDAVESMAGRVVALRPQETDEAGVRMMLHLGIFVSAREMPEIRRRLSILVAERAAEGWRLDLTGPWPPYAFCPSLETEADG